MRWAILGAIVGTLVGLLAFAPATMLARAVADATGGRVLLTEARGTLWGGSAVLVLTGGPGSRDAASLPGRLSWNVGVRGTALELRLRQACCLNGEVALRLKPGFGRTDIVLPPVPQAGGWAAQWPAAWLSGLGTPWNTLQLGGVLKFTTPGVTLESVQGRLRLNGDAELLLLGASSRLSTLDTLGSYRLQLRGDPSNKGPARITLSTIEGGLQLSGSGEWGGGRLHFRGQAQAAPGSEAALNNLLNIIGRRQGALSIISIG
ncbi:MAG TPA: type II secretion system protein N [Burkholderiaceae bacterium]|nr:type II secretion system protein N [Burkholderiaceae bacterium]